VNGRLFRNATGKETRLQSRFSNRTGESAERKKELAPLPNNVSVSVGTLIKPLDLIILFADSQRMLKAEFPRLARKLVENGMLWIAWPKKASGIATDLSDNSVRSIGLTAGLVDVKVCAINDVWSGLKFVYRLEDRSSR